MAHEKVNTTKDRTPGYDQSLLSAYRLIWVSTIRGCCFYVFKFCLFFEDFFDCLIDVCCWLMFCLLFCLLCLLIVVFGSCFDLLFLCAACVALGGWFFARLHNNISDFDTSNQPHLKKASNQSIKFVVCCFLSVVCWWLFVVCCQPINQSNDNNNNNTHPTPCPSNLPTLTHPTPLLTHQSYMLSLLLLMFGVCCLLFVVACLLVCTNNSSISFYTMMPCYVVSCVVLLSWLLLSLLVAGTVVVVVLVVVVATAAVRVVACRAVSCQCNVTSC